jgi:RimJ/RimL family protein N-acetyltransferase
MKSPSSQPVHIFSDRELEIYRNAQSGTLQIGYEFAPEYWGKGYASEAIRPVVEDAFKSLKRSGSPESPGLKISLL